MNSFWVIDGESREAGTPLAFDRLPHRSPRANLVDLTKRINSFSVDFKRLKA
jgi:hypothetical protein